MIPTVLANLTVRGITFRIKERKLKKDCTNTCFFIRNQFIRNLHVESRKIKKLLELHYMTILYDLFLK